MGAALTATSMTAGCSVSFAVSSADSAGAPIVVRPVPVNRRQCLTLAASLFVSAGNGRDAFAQDASPVVPEPVQFPRDDGPHPQPVEWWYVTGHLFTPAGDRYGFELVAFKGQSRGRNGYAMHFAITDNRTGTFHYDQHIGLAPNNANAETDAGFAISLGDWRMAGKNGDVRLVAAMPGYAVDLTLTAAKPPALHGDAGFLDFGDRGFTYYYSRTRIDATGTLTLGTSVEPVTGQCWFDHQWGRFTTFQHGGWDWYALQFDDRTELMLYLLRDQRGAVYATDGTWVEPDGSANVLRPGDFATHATGSWTSPATGTVYPSGWTVAVPAVGLAMTLTPALVDQELDTAATTQVIYWEGEVTIAGTRAGSPVTGLGYVELTGYAAP
jgi:predicted secreted hydrolase